MIREKKNSLTTFITLMSLYNNKRVIEIFMKEEKSGRRVPEPQTSLRKDEKIMALIMIRIH